MGKHVKGRDVSTGYQRGYTWSSERDYDERPRRESAGAWQREHSQVTDRASAGDPLRHRTKSQVRTKPQATERRTPPQRPDAPKKPTAFQKYLKTPKGYVTLLLAILMVIGALHISDARGIVNAAVAVVTALVIDTFVALIQRRPKIRLSDGGIVTALIVALVLSTTATWDIVMITTGIAVLSKHLIKSGRKPIFNPAAFGLLVAIYVFHVGESWWGDLASLPNIAMIAVLVTGFMITSRVNKFPQVFTFLAVYFAIFLGLGLLHNTLAADAFRNPIINSTLFLAFFMMTDPPTSPAKYRHQAAFGAITAIVSSAIYLTVGGLTYLLIGLLVANVWKAIAVRQPGVAAKKQKEKESVTNVRVRGMDY